MCSGTPKIPVWYKQPTGNYFARLPFPDDTELLMKCTNELIICTKQACFRQDISAEGLLGPVGADLHQQQSEFPKHMNGIRLHRHHNSKRAPSPVTEGKMLT